MGWILARAGREEETLRQIEENLERFPEDVWVTINAGDVLYAFGDKRAEEYFLKAYEMAEQNKYDRIGALERLIDFYESQGIKEKAVAFRAEYDRLVAPPFPPKQVFKTKKIGFLSIGRVGFELKVDV